MLLLLVAASGFAVQSMFIAEGLADEVSESVSDLGRVSQAKSTDSYFFYDYLKSASEYSIHQATYDLGQEGGGEDWTSDDFELRGRMQINLHRETNQYFEENYVKDSFGGLNCNFKTNDFNIYMPIAEDSAETNHISGGINVQFGQFFVTQCNYLEGEVVHKSDTLDRDTIYNATYNRYYQLVEEQLRFHQDVRAELNDIDRTHTGTDYECGSPASLAQAENDAVDEAEDEVEDALRRVARNYPTIDGFEFADGPEVENIDYEVTDTSEGTAGDCNCRQVCTTDYQEGDSGTKFDTYKGDSKTEMAAVANDGSGGGSTDPDDPFSGCTGSGCFDTGNDGGGGSGETCTEVCDTRYRADVDIRIDAADIRTVIQDDKYWIPTEAGWRHLEFVVDPYQHDFTGTTTSSSSGSTTTGDAWNDPFTGCTGSQCFVR